MIRRTRITDCCWSATTTLFAPALDSARIRIGIWELQLSIGINHSMVEDPFLFLPFGISAFWLWVPRLITAMAATRMLTLWVSWTRKEKSAVSG